MAEAWMRLDTNIFHDPAIEDLFDLKKEAGVYYYLNLCCIAHDNYGQIDLSKPAMRKHVEKHTGLKGKRLDSIIDACVECELFDREQWGRSVVTSNRLLFEGAKRYSSEQQKVDAALKSAEKRRQQAAEREASENAGGETDG